MANSIGWGSVYSVTNWGKGVINNISWGKVYANLAGAIPSFALNFATIATDFTFTRNSFTTRVNEQGLIETVTDLSSELITNGDFEELGAELIVNGDFSNGSTGWNFYNVGGLNGWRILDGRAICDTVNPLSGRNLNSTLGLLTSGKTYKLTLDILQSVDGMTILVGSTSLAAKLPTGTNLGYEYIIDGSLHTGGVFSLYGGSSDLQEIDNVSIKEIDPNGDWGKVNSTISGGTGNLDGTGAVSMLYQSILTNTKTYTATFTVSNYNGLGEARVIDSSGGALYTITSNGTFTFTFTHSNVSSSFLFRARTNAIYSIDNVSVKEVFEDDVPRIDYSSGEGAFLLEPATTNLVNYSEDFTQWSLQGNTLNLISGVAPDGSTSVYELTSVSSGKLQEVISGLAINTTYTFSFYVKQTSPTTTVYSRILSQTGGSGGTNLTLVEYQDQLVTDEWVRITHTFTTNDTLGDYIVYVANSLTAGESLQFWGAQVESLSYATSYIPTDGTIATRAAELCVDATPTINSEEGVLYVETSALVNGGANRYISLSGGTTTNRLQLIYSSAASRLSVGGVNNGVALTSVNDNSFDQTVNHKIAVAYSASGLKVFVDGVLKDSSLSNASFPIGSLTDLDFSIWNSSSAPFYGNTKDLKVYDKLLTDDELVTLTTI